LGVFDLGIRIQIHSETRFSKTKCILLTNLDSDSVTAA